MPLVIINSTHYFFSLFLIVCKLCANIASGILVNFHLQNESVEFSRNSRITFFLLFNMDFGSLLSVAQKNAKTSTVSSQVSTDEMKNALTGYTRLCQRKTIVLFV